MFPLGLAKFAKDIISWVADPKNRTIILFISVAIFAVLFFRQCNTIEELKNEQSRYQSNISAITDSLESYRLDNGDLVSEKGALQTTTKELRDINKELYDELQKEKNKPPKTITVIKTVVERDTFYTDDSKYTYLGEDSYRISWTYQESGGWGLRALEGNSRFDFIGDSTLTNINTQITKDIFEISITTGFRETDDGKLQAFARTSAPNVSFTQVDGAIIDPKNYVSIDPKRWGLALTIGYGVNTSFEPSPYIGIGISYNFIQW